MSIFILIGNVRMWVTAPKTIDFKQDILQFQQYLLCYTMYMLYEHQLF